MLNQINENKNCKYDNFRYLLDILNKLDLSNLNSNDVRKLFELSFEYVSNLEYSNNKNLMEDTLNSVALSVLIDIDENYNGNCFTNDLIDYYNSLKH